MASSFNWWELRTKVTGKENILIHLPFGRIIHEWIWPDHPDYNGGDY